MKQILLALTVIGLMHTSANAQTKSKYDINYDVCKTNGKYHVCGTNTPQISDGYQKPTDNKTEVVSSLRRMDTYVHMGYGTPGGSSFKNNPRFRVSYDDPNGAYEGKETLTNDGVQKNINRNVNYLDNSVNLPPVDGE